MSDVWAKLEGHAVNGVYPLRRFLGGSNHSVVFLTESAKRGQPELALKLVPAVPALAQLQLARWRASAALVHPHLIQIFEAGQCQIGERPFLYVVTDYADQNLAQLLERRALTEGEASEMLTPVLDALAFLHEKKLVQGRLKPSNVLVVGDQIKLASDTIRPISDAGRASNLTSPYMPPEARDGTRTAASDVWGLGITLSEALTRHKPSGLHTNQLVLPAELSPAFRGVVTRCLSARAKDRPTVNELQVWARGAQVVAASGGASRTGSIEVVGNAGRPASLPAGGGSGTPSQRLSMGSVVAVIVGAMALFAMGWAAVRSSGPNPARAMPDAVVENPRAAAPALVPTASDSREAAEPVVPDEPVPVREMGTIQRSSVAQKPAAAGSARPELPVAPEPEAAFTNGSAGEVLPEVPERTQKGIRGSIRVSVRLIVDKQGKVFAALVDDPGPSRYFEKLALEAAEKWTFPAFGTERLMLVRFEFTRQGVTARATPIR